MPPRPALSEGGDDFRRRDPLAYYHAHEAGLTWCSPFQRDGALYEQLGRKGLLGVPTK